MDYIVHEVTKNQTQLSDFHLASDIFLELSCFFYDPIDVDNLISGSSAFFQTGLNIWKFSVHILMMPGLENFECYTASM